MTTPYGDLKENFPARYSMFGFNFQSISLALLTIDQLVSIQKWSIAVEEQGGAFLKPQA
jgi:hypothetical protein